LETPEKSVCLIAWGPSDEPVRKEDLASNGTPTREIFELGMRC